MKGRLSPLWLAMLVLAFLRPQVDGCLNEYRPNYPARQRSDEIVRQLTEHPVVEEWPARRDRLRELLAKGGSFQVKNDLAAALMHTGEAPEAVRLLTEVEAEKPGLYFTAANLGTAYELSGDNQKALEWIRQGIERNPDAHAGSEWLHVKILEAKIAIEGDEHWLETHSVISDEFQMASGSGVMGNLGQELSVQEIKEAIIYQLHERLQFVPVPEAVVGALLLDLFKAVRVEPTGIGGTKGILELAAPYLAGLPNDHPLSHELQFDRRMFDSMADRGPGGPFRLVNQIGVFGAVFVGLMLCLSVVMLLRWGRRLRS